MLTERHHARRGRRHSLRVHRRGPEVYTQAWRGEIPWRKLSGNVYEYACHEGNYGLFNILSGAREQERTGRTLELTALEE